MSTLPSASSLESVEKLQSSRIKIKLPIKPHKQRSRSSAKAFVRLPNILLGSEIFRSLSPLAVVVFVDMNAHCGPQTNGVYHYGIRDIRKRFKVGSDNARAALKELQAVKLIACETRATFTTVARDNDYTGRAEIVLHRFAREWLITTMPAYGARKATHEWMQPRPSDKDLKRFAALPKDFIRSPSYQNLSVNAKALFVHMNGRFRGINNGKIEMSAREAAELLHVSTMTGSRALNELKTNGLIEPAQTTDFVSKRCPQRWWINLYRK